MATIFSKILSGEIPSYKIAENEHYFAFLDVFPCALGHTLVIPKKEVDYIFDMNETEYLGLMAFAKEIEPAIKKAIPCKKVGVAVIGLEVPHAHVHLIPMNQISDMDFTKKLKPTAEELSAIAERIKSYL